MINLQLPLIFSDIQKYYNNINIKKKYFDYLPQDKQYEYESNLIKILSDLYNQKILENKFVLSSNIGLIVYRILSFYNKNDLILLEDPCYLCFINSTKVRKLDYDTIPIEKDGINTDILQSILEKNKHKKILLIIVPYYQNPTGVNYSEEKKKIIVEMTNKHPNLTVISDEIYYFHDNNFKKPLYFYGGQNIISLGSFSKIFCPSLKYGWIIGKNELVKKINANNYNMISYFDINVMNDIIINNDMKYIIEDENKKINHTNIIETKILKKYLGDYIDIEGNHPEFYWCKFKDKNINLDQFVDDCKKNGVLIRHGNDFRNYIHKDKYFRLILHPNSKIFNKGIKIIKKVLDQI
jgi:2-aminoadipate transaminase